MAWITKNSGGMVVDRRDEPYLSDELKQRLETDLVSQYPTRQAATMGVLHAIQEQVGYLPYQAIEETAAFLEIPASRVLDTATFYEEYFLKPHGKYVIWVCQSLSCELMNHTALLDHLREKLGIEVGETTADGKFTLEIVECLGSCGTAPVALVNERLHENLNVQNVDEILDSLES